MNILTLTDVFFPDTVGGAGRVAYHLGRELSRMGHMVHVVSRNPGGSLLGREKLEERFWVHRFYVPSRQSILSLFHELINSFLLVKKMVGRNNFDAVCIHQSLVAAGPLLIRALRSVPVIYFFHSPWHEEHVINKQGLLDINQKGLKIVPGSMRVWEKKILEKSSKIIVLSEYMSRKLMQTHRGLPSDIGIIRGGVDLDRFSLPADEKNRLKESLGLPENRTLFLTIRNLVPRMGLENLVHAFEGTEILRQKGCLLIGGSGSLESRLRSMIRRNNLSSAVKLLGYIPEEQLADYYRAADYFILPTEKLEGFGLVILEAMACGIPVLGTPVGAIPEILGEFDKRLLFDSTSRADLRNKLEGVVENQEDYRFDPHACRGFIERHYSWQKMAGEVEKELLNSSEAKCKNR